MVFSARKQSGFTLIELSIVIVIVGLLLAGFLQAYAIYEENRRIERTELLMSDIEEAIKAFPAMIDPATVQNDPVTGQPIPGTGTAYGRLPCPAPLGGRGGGIRFNQEDCSTANGNIRIRGTDNEWVLIGKLPAAELGISSDHMRDTHGNYLIYAVTEKLATAGVDAVSGAIKVTEKGIEDDPGDPDYGKIKFQKNHKYVQYVVVSPGASGDGAYAYDGTQTVDGKVGKKCKDSKKEEYENCDEDAHFIFSLLSERNNKRFYDDKVIFENNVLGDRVTLESAECEQFDTVTVYGDSCPEGWKKMSNGYIQGYPRVDVAESFVRDVPDLGPHYTSSTMNHQKYDQGNGYFNIDKETGNYFVSNFPTPNSFNKDVRYHATHMRGTTCEKKGGNTKVSCFNKKINATAGADIAFMTGDTSTESGYKKANEACPEGYKVIEIKVSTVYVGENNYRPSRRVSSVVCGQ